MGIKLVNRTMEIGRSQEEIDGLKDVISHSFHYVQRGMNGKAYALAMGLLKVFTSGYVSILA